MVNTPTVGIFIGLLLGTVLVFEGFGAMLIVALFGGLGYLVVKVAEGDVDLNHYLGSRNRSR